MLAGAERIAMDVERRRSRAVLERLFVTFEAPTRVRAGDSIGFVVEPFGAPRRSARGMRV